MARCPICKNRVEARGRNPYAPFCSERCKLIDLGNWLGEGYRIPEGESDPEREREHGPDRGVRPKRGSR